METLKIEVKTNMRFPKIHEQTLNQIEPWSISLRLITNIMTIFIQLFFS